MPNAVILAGIQPIKGWDGEGNKALYRIHGKMMVEYVIDALKCVKNMGRIVVVGREDELSPQLSGKVDALVDSDGTVIQNLLAGIRRVGQDDPILVCSSDIPMITAEAVEDFISRADALHVDFCYPIVERSLNEAAFPGMERTYVRMKEGSFTGGNIFLVNPKLVEKGAPFVGQLIENRKNPVRMARLFGVSFLLRLLSGRLSIGKVERKFTQMLGIRARAVISPYPSVGNDVDKPCDIVYVEAWFEKNRLFSGFHV